MFPELVHCLQLARLVQAALPMMKDTQLMHPAITGRVAMLFVTCYGLVEFIACRPVLCTWKCQFGVEGGKALCRQRHPSYKAYMLHPSKKIYANPSLLGSI